MTTGDRVVVPSSAPASAAPAAVPASAGRSIVGLTLAAALLLVLPVLVAAVLPTADGPSHVYNAYVAESLGAEGSPLADFYVYHGGPGPNRAADAALRGLGSALGWEAGERVLLLLALTGAFALLLWLTALEAPPRAMGVLLAAWLSGHWFAWTGFYDFTLSILPFCGVLIGLRVGRGWPRALLLQPLLLAAFATHLLTFAAAIGVILTWVAVELGSRRARPAELLAVVPAMALLLLTPGGALGSDWSWAGKWKALPGLLVGDFLIAFSWADAIAGLIAMALFWAWLVARRPRAVEVRSLSPAWLVAALLVIGSVTAPEAIGEGSYIGARLRFLAVLVALPGLAALRFRGPRPGAAVAVALILAFGVHTAMATRSARQVATDHRALAAMLDQVNAAAGEGVQTRLVDHERGLLRVSAYAHLIERAARERDLIVLDNYEAWLDIFPVAWRAVPDRLRFDAQAGTWSARVQTAVLPLPPRVHVLHDAARALDAGPCLRVTDRARLGSLALTSLAESCRP